MQLWDLPSFFYPLSHILGILITLMHLRLAQMQEEGQEQNSGRTGSLAVMQFLFSPRTQNL